MKEEDERRFVRKVGKYKVKVVPGKCIAAASCVAISPEIFKLNEENIAEVIQEGEDGEENVLLAAQSCPTGAIEIWDGEKKVWPS